MRSTLTLCTLLAMAAPLAAGAQGRGRDGRGVPPGHLPPPGSCRVWVDGVPPGRQSPPTDCATAERTRLANGRVIYGDAGGGYDDDRRGKGKGKHKDGRRDDRDTDSDRDSDRDTDRRTDRRTDDRCLDRDRDGRCDFRADSARIPGTGTKIPLPLPAPRTEPTRSPGTTVPTVPRVESGRRALPEMVPVTMIEQRRRTRDQERWLGAGDVAGRYVDADQNGVPERITWLDRAGMVRQVWRDDDRNGRANSVAVYERGRLTQMVRE